MFRACIVGSFIGTVKGCCLDKLLHIRAWRLAEGLGRSMAAFFKEDAGNDTRCSRLSKRCRKLSGMHRCFAKEMFQRELLVPFCTGVSQAVVETPPLRVEPNNNSTNKNKNWSCNGKNCTRLIET